MTIQGRTSLVQDRVGLHKTRHKKQYKEGKDMIGQVKGRIDKRREDKTRQHKTRQDWTTQDKTRYETIRHE
jgi:hypothetical protein